MGADDNGAMNLPAPIDGGVRLTHLALLRARGGDAARFLQGQLTNDVEGLGRNAARLAGFCSAKGRLQASFVVWKAAEEEFLLLCAADLLPALLTRLSMFVLRAQCKLGDAGAEFDLWGLAGAGANDLAGEVWSVRHANGATAIRLPDAAGSARWLWLQPAAWATIPPWPAIALPVWRWLEVQSGVPIIEAATVDRFVPQMLNYEILGGIDFRKGCYPGQEVVARSQYRGTIKRRMFLFDIDRQTAPGQEVFHDADAAQPAGMVVNAAPRPDGAGWSALVELKLAATEAGALHLGRPDGAVLRRADLPYAVPLEASEPT
jgi:folate-binding protein YgfZ